MRWMRGATVVVALFAVAAVPAAASPLVLAPPGHAGANQYFETIPTSSGDAAPPGSASGSGTANGTPSALSQFGHGRRGDAQLARLGTHGRAAAALAAATAPRSPTGSQAPTGSPTRTGSPSTADSGAASSSSSGGGGSVLSGISHALTGSDGGGLGLALPLLLVTALLAAVGIAGTALWRRATA